MRGIPAGRPLTRAAILFASAAAASACSSSSTPPTGAKDAAVSKDATDDLGQGMTLYGVTRDSGQELPDGDLRAAYGVMVAPEGGGAPLYGAMAHPDAGTAHEPDGGAVAAYGVMVPPEDAGTH